MDNHDSMSKAKLAIIQYKIIAKGGSCIHSLTESKISNDLTYEKPACWLGFRNICEYKYWE